MRQDPIVMNFIPGYECAREFVSQSGDRGFLNSLKWLYFAAAHPQESLGETLGSMLLDAYNLGPTRKRIGDSLRGAIIINARYGGDEGKVISIEGEFTPILLRTLEEHLGNVESPGFRRILNDELFAYVSKNSGPFSWGGSLRTTEDRGIEAYGVKVEIPRFGDRSYETLLK